MIDILDIKALRSGLHYIVFATASIILDGDRLLLLLLFRDITSD